jgi:hypothetical protein
VGELVSYPSSLLTWKPVAYGRRKRRSAWRVVWSVSTTTLACGCSLHAVLSAYSTRWYAASRRCPSGSPAAGSVGRNVTNATGSGASCRPRLQSRSTYDAKVANRDVRDFGWKVAHEAVTRRPPISLDTMVPRTGDYAYDVGV